MNKILFFAHLRDVVGSESIEEEAKGLTVAELKEKILVKYPALNLENAMTSMNEEFSSDDEVIREGDVVAFIPPVSGG